MIALFVLGCAILVLVAHFSPWAQNRRKLLAAQKRAIAALGDGYARISGKVVALETIEAPLSGRPCVYYEVVVEAEGVADWSTVAEERDGVPFLVEDATRRAIVVPTDVDAVFTRATVIGPTRPSNLYEDLIVDRDGRGPKLLDRHLQGPGHRILRYVETRIEPGTTIAVAGHGVDEPDPDPRAAGAGGYRGGPPMRVRMVGTRAHRLLLSDRPETLH